ncbi:MAG: hypothetical protein ABI972_10010 [Acidobacteriota bacterium]
MRFAAMRIHDGVRRRSGCEVPADGIVKSARKLRVEIVKCTQQIRIGAAKPDHRVGKEGPPELLVAAVGLLSEPNCRSR